LVGLGDPYSEAEQMTMSLGRRMKRKCVSLYLQEHTSTVMTTAEHINPIL